MQTIATLLVTSEDGALIAHWPSTGTQELMLGLGTCSILSCEAGLTS